MGTDARRFSAVELHEEHIGVQPLNLRVRRGLEVECAEKDGERRHDEQELYPERLFEDEPQHGSQYSTKPPRALGKIPKIFRKNAQREFEGMW